MRLGNCATWHRARQSMRYIFDIMWYIYLPCELPLDPKLLEPLWGQIAFAFDKCDAFIGAAARGIYAACCAFGKLCSLHFMFRQRKSKYVNTLSHTHTQQFAPLVRANIRYSSCASCVCVCVCLCVRHWGQFIVYLKLWTCETTSSKWWARGVEAGGRGVHRGV